MKSLVKENGFKEYLRDLLMDLNRIIKDKTRKDILIYLKNKGKATYSEILRDMKLSTGKLNYHLKILEPLIEKEGEYYKLNEKGEQLVSIMLSIEGDKDETLYNKVLPQYLALLGVVLLILSASIHQGSQIFYVIYVMSIIALISSAFLGYVIEPRGFEKLMVILSLVVPFAFYLFTGYTIKLPIIIYTFQGFATIKIYFYALIPTLIYFFGILPRYVNENSEFITNIIWSVIIIIDAFTGFLPIPFIDLMSLLMGFSLYQKRNEMKNYFPLLALSIAVIILSLVIKKFYFIN
ncbi:winged helix-turn-helix domain-containing protein [Acidianus ambivalens]|uniref:Winged helix-turn-helix transcriptional regulator n=1 Tax=Acidianus ambivalens TaxID=2283 RepID=A0A650CX86_ACIAM|nr:winged helix-turn-helix domain-containing protein [Acidianus ambivalens]MQL54238.1 winged helix-turn-helix transcriptional regulator [Acidianus ambivalens]QGR22067.1 winged helix-turn-helix transcriptional regulator [Acidianus ambivalens]